MFTRSSRPATDLHVEAHGGGPLYLRRLHLLHARGRRRRGAVDAAAAAHLMEIAILEGAGHGLMDRTNLQSSSQQHFEGAVPPLEKLSHTYLNVHRR